MSLADIDARVREKLARLQRDAEQFDQVRAGLDAALADLRQGTRTLLRTKDARDPGPALPVGTGGNVAHDQLPRQERLIGDSNFLPVSFLEKGAIVQRAVGRVTLTDSFDGLPAGSGLGTGFLVGDSLFLTNHHVIPDAAFTAKVEVQFNFQQDIRGRPLQIDPYDFDAASSFLTDAGLDFTLVRLRPNDRTSVPLPPGAAPAAGASVPAGTVWGHLRLQETVIFAEKQAVNIVQHPSGRMKEVAIQDNVVQKVFADVIRYTTDTEPGSSGSPVFNNTWDLIALHHAAGDQQDGVWLNNEGVRIDRIVQQLRDKLTPSPAGQAVLRELGL